MVRRVTTPGRHNAATPQHPLHARAAKPFVVLIALTLGATACGSAIEEAAPTPTTSVAQTTTTPPTTVSSTTTPPVLEFATPNITEGTWVATAIGDGVEAWLEKPEQGVPTETGITIEPAADWWFPDPTQFEGPRVFLAIEADGPLIKVALPIQPNGSTGWIRADSVTLEQITFHAEVDLANHQLTVWDGDEIVVQTSASTGKPSTPTPLGEFFVRDVIPSRSSGSYGSYILGLSGFSETLETFNGGLPAIAIHGTNRPDLVGQEVSNGCIRIPNEYVEVLAATVPLGTPVRVVG